MKSKAILLSFFPLIILSFRAYPQQPSELKKPTATLMNINKVSAWVHADGRVGRSPHPSFNPGIIYPRGTAGAVYLDGIIWGGFVKDGHKPELRAGGSMHRVGMSPGAILSRGIAEDTASSDVRIWRIRRDWQTADLTADASEFFNVSLDSITQNQIDDLRSLYERDWHAWPWQKGAPYYDDNGNGSMDEGEEPGVANADQVVWLVSNDLDSNLTLPFMGRPPIGLEMQTTLWAYDRFGSRLNEALQHVVFKQVELIYKGRSDTPDTARIDSMFIGQFVESDIGSARDDLAGCDTMLELGYGYNGNVFDADYAEFNLPPPAFGYMLLQGPLIPSDDPSNNGRFDFGRKAGFMNLKMTSFWLHASGGANGLPGGKFDFVAPRFYKLLNGFFPFPGPDTEQIPMWDHNRKPTKFIASGDPVTGTGFVDGEDYGFAPGYGGHGPGERYWSMNSGPFRMALGDTQEVVLAMVGGLGSDRLASISVMKHYAKWANLLAMSNFSIDFSDERSAHIQSIPPQDYQLYQNFPNPIRNGTTIRYGLPIERSVKLTVFNLIGQEVITLANEIQKSGVYAYNWDGRDSAGQRVAKGIYIYKLEAGAVILTRKILVIN